MHEMQVRVIGIIDVMASRRLRWRSVGRAGRVCARRA